MLVSLFAVSCSKDKGAPADQAPVCILTKIEQFKRDQPQQLSVWQYEYDGMTVYYIPGAGCMRLGELLDINCKLICHPDGGFTGMGDGKCNDFFKKRKNEKLIWKDER